LSHLVKTERERTGLDLLPSTEAPGGDNFGSVSIRQMAGLPQTEGIGEIGTTLDRKHLESEALGQLLDDFRPFLLTIAERFFPEELVPKLGHSDLVQETLVKGYQSFSTFEGTTREELATWLRRILLNHLHNVRETLQTSKRDYRREQPLQDSLVEGKDLTASQALLAREERERFDAAFARLPERLSRVLLLRNRDRLSFAAIGKCLSLSETRTRDLWVQGVEILRKELEGPSPGQDS